jgi:hypothetical protein
MYLAASGCEETTDCDCALSVRLSTPSKPHVRTGTALGETSDECLYLGRSGSPRSGALNVVGPLSSGGPILLLVLCLNLPFVKWEGVFLSEMAHALAGFARLFLSLASINRRIVSLELWNGVC